MRRALIFSLAIGLTLFALALFLREPGQSQPLSAVALLDQSTPQGFARADAPRDFAFPADLGPHPNFQTEWWYYTGNLHTSDGRHFGYQLTFFRRALLPQDKSTPRASAWATNQLYMAHFALTDSQSQQHYAFERLSRESPGLAGAEGSPLNVWLEDWSIQLATDGRFHLLAQAEGINLDLLLQDLKGPILHGENGLSQKGPQLGDASYYFSQTRLASQGSLTIADEDFIVEGLSWMDHEFSTSALAPGQIGWDWFSIQFDDGRELMLFQLRRSDGQPDAYSSATLVELDGSTQSLGEGDFTLQPLDYWTSPKSGARYPIAWHISISSLDFELDARPLLEDQELNLAFTYWEGAVAVSGTQAGMDLSGMGYIELTGYAHSMEGQF